MDTKSDKYCPNVYLRSSDIGKEAGSGNLGQVNTLIVLEL